MMMMKSVQRRAMHVPEDNPFPETGFADAHIRDSQRPAMVLEISWHGIAGTPKQLCVLIGLWLLVIGVADTGNRVDIQDIFVNSQGPFTCSANTLDEVDDFCLFRALKKADCDTIKELWLDQRRLAVSQASSCNIYLVLMNPEKLFENISDRWLQSLLPKKCKINVIRYVDRPEDFYHANQPGFTFLPSKTSPRTIVMFMTTLHEFGVLHIEQERAFAMQAIARRMQATLKSKGGGKVVLVVANDEFKKFPLSLYTKFDTVFRLGDFDPRPCLAGRLGCHTTHWIPRGPSKKAFHVLSNAKSNTVLKDFSLHQSASQRTYLANFIGNVDCALCVTISKGKGERILKKSCYRTPFRSAVLQGLYNAKSKFKKDVFLRPLSGYALDSTHGTKEGMSQEEFLGKLSNSVFTICAPGASPESTRIYEALEAGSIPILQKPTMEGGLLFGPNCPLPYIDSHSPDIWQKEIVSLLLHWQDQPATTLDLYQNNVKDWWREFKISLRIGMEKILFAPKITIAKEVVDTQEALELHEFNDQLIFLNRMVEANEVGSTSKAKSIIYQLTQLCQQQITERINMQGEFANGCPSLLSSAAYVAHIVNLKQEFFCLANASLWFDPFSPTLHDMIVSTHWQQEQFSEWETIKNFTQLLHLVNNHSKAYQRYPLLPRRMLKIWRGGAAVKELMLGLQLCLANDDALYGSRPSMWYHGFLDDKDIKGMLERHLWSSPPPLYDQV